MSAVAPGEVGVVIPVGRRSTIDLERQFDALLRQTWTGPVHLVVSCNSEPVADVERLLGAVDWPVGWSATAIDSSAVPGASAARNAGCRTLRTELVLFCDADDEVTETWIASMVDGLRRDGVTTGPLRFDGLNASWMWRTRESTWPHVRFGYLPTVQSANLGVRRHVFDTIGGFDETMGSAEDIDFAWRAHEAGYPTGWEPGAAVQYRLRARTTDLFRNHRHYARWDPVLVERHREHGAHWRTRDVVREVLSAGKSIAVAPFSPLRRREAAIRLGTLVGWAERVIGRRPSST